jgi:hypothetical protein
MQEDYDHFGWEGLYRLYGVFEESNDELSSPGETEKGPIPLTQFS